jgi:hypothetical protein
MASENIVGFRRSLLSALWDSVAADSMAYARGLFLATSRLHGIRNTLTAAGQILEIDIPSLPSLFQSIERPIVNTLIPTFPIAYAVLPRKKRL